MPKQKQNLTEAQKLVLQSLKDNGPINVRELHGNRVNMLNDLRARRLVYYENEHFIAVKERSNEEKDEYILDNYAPGIKCQDIAKVLGVSPAFISQALKRLNLAGARRGRPNVDSKYLSARLREKDEPINKIERPPATYGNQSFDDRVNKILNTPR